MNEKPKKPNIYNVAALAGVSHQTVSRVINNHHSIRPETRQRVERAMAKLGYTPNPAARSLVTSRSRIIGMLVADSVLYGPTGMLSAMERRARDAGYFAVTVGVRADSEESWAEGIAHLLRLNPEGFAVIALPKGAGKTLAKASNGKPMVAIDADGAAAKWTVGIDNFVGGGIATEHLKSLGHKRVLHIVGLESSFEAQERKRGYESSMRASDLEPITIQGDWDTETGFKIGIDLNLDMLGVTAIFAGNDQLALGLLKAFRIRGIEVPKDLSMIGFDDIPEAPYFVPPLTTVRQDFNKLGDIAIKLLIGQMNGGPEEQPEKVLPELIIRESTAKLQ